MVFLLAAGFVLRQIVVTGDYSDPGGPFRYLTVWGLLLSFFCASRMLALTERRSDRDWPRLVMVTAMVNALVVVMYWKLWFEDPALVNAGAPLPWWVDGYLHGLGPLLQWADALFVHRGFRRPMQAVAPYLALVVAYLAWIEGVVAPANAYPLGAVTGGLPYPFLNDMEPFARGVFYVGTAGLGLVALGAFWGLARVVRVKERPQP